MEQKTFINSFSYIRIIACFSIIVLHLLFASTVYFGTVMSDEGILFEKVLEHTLMFGVPLFLMVTGALLLDTNRILTTKKWIRYFKRIVIALLSFSFIFMILQDVFEDGMQSNIVFRWIDIILNGKSWAHMWYLYLMIVMYLLLPVLKNLVSKINYKTLLLLIIVLVIASTVFSLTSDPGITFGAVNIHLSNLVYPTYMLIGYYFYNNKIEVLPSVILFIVSTTIIVIGTFFSDSFSAFCSYSSVLVVLQALGLYSLMLNINHSPSTLIKDVDKCTFGIYLIHMIGVRGIMKWWGFNPYDYGMLSFVFIAIILFAISYLITTLLKRIPKLNLL